MTRREAQDIVGPGFSRVDTWNLAHGLSLVPWRNTSDEWLRLEAAVTLLGSSAPVRARQALMDHQLHTLTSAFAKPSARPLAHCLKEAA